jgi:molybdate transport system substrate-binding protein
VSDIKIPSTTAMKTSLDALAPDFRRSSGHTLDCSFAPSARIAQRVSDGEPCDAVIGTDRGVADLIRQGRIAAGSGREIARSAMALAVQKGAPRPDISSAEKFKQAMLATKSLAMSNPVGGGQSGANLAMAFERLGIADAMKGKTIYGPGGPAGLIGNFLLRGEVEIGVQQLPELMAVPGIDIVGPLPDGVQSMTVFTVALSSGARDPEAARALIDFLASPAAAKVMREMGFEAG